VEEVGDFKEFIKPFVPADNDKRRLVGHTKPLTFLFTKKDGKPIMQVTTLKFGLIIHNEYHSVWTCKICT
jgi:hypothetical protein